jgi:hypothetical protein
VQPDFNVDKRIALAKRDTKPRRHESRPKGPADIKSPIPTFAYLSVVSVNNSLQDILYHLANVVHVTSEGFMVVSHSKPDRYVKRR